MLISPPAPLSREVEGKLFGFLKKNQISVKFKQTVYYARIQLEHILVLNRPSAFNEGLSFQKDCETMSWLQQTTI